MVDPTIMEVRHPSYGKDAKFAFKERSSLI